MTTRCLRPVLKRYLRFPPIEFIISVCKVGQLHLPQALGKIEIKVYFDLNRASKHGVCRDTLSTLSTLSTPFLRIVYVEIYIVDLKRRCIWVSSNLSLILIGSGLVN